MKQPGSKRLLITENEVRYAMQNSNSNAGAAAFLHISVITWKKYAEAYIDEETGKTLYDLHRGKPNKAPEELRIAGIKNRAMMKFLNALSGKRIRYSLRRLQERLVKYGIVKNECSQCHYDEVRLDGALPLVLTFNDDDPNNMEIGNVRLLCYNCHFINGGTLDARKFKAIKYENIQGPNL